MSGRQNMDRISYESEQKMLSDSGYSKKAIQYVTAKPFLGVLPDADYVSEMQGTCGDTMKMFLKIDQGIIKDATYQVLGCPGAVASAMAVVDLIKGKSIAHARSIGDDDVFRALEEIPAQKHHCIQLSVKTLHKALAGYGNGDSPTPDKTT